MKKIIAALLVFILLLPMAGCKAREVTVPEDFSFALTWNTYGISSYDSETGKLIKTTDASSPDDFVTNHKLTDEEKTKIYALISSLDVSSYHDVYDPQNGMSEPSMTLILTVRENGKEKTIRAENISLSFESKNKKGRRFLGACEDIIDILTATDEWKALPDYERYYK